MMGAISVQLALVSVCLYRRLESWRWVRLGRRKGIERHRGLGPGGGGEVRCPRGVSGFARTGGETVGR